MRQLMKDQIEAKLRAAFAPTEIEVVDDSEAHRGHAGWRDGGQTHFKVTIRAAAFDGLSRIAAQRAIHATLREELKDKIHALNLDVKAANP